MVARDSVQFHRLRCPVGFAVHFGAQRSAKVERLNGFELLNQKDFRDIVSGQRTGAIAWLIRKVLAVVSCPYGAIVRFRNRQYDEHRFSVHRVDVPVICVGNITMGGTGKTPMVCYLAEWFSQRGVRVVIVSRGYRSEDGGLNDEARELADKLPTIPHLQDVDRVAAAKRAIEQHDAQVVLLDDGYQHRRLGRDLDVVLIDALEPFGFDRVFPSGMLREPATGLKRAHFIALSRADAVPAERRREIRDRVERYGTNAKWLEVVHAPTELRSRRGRTLEISELRGKRVLAFCGLGNPAGFRQTLAACGPQVVDFQEFPDHHDYSSRDLEGLSGWVDQHEVQMIVCTHKDLVKIDTDELCEVPLLALVVELQIVVGADDLAATLAMISKKVDESAK